MTLFGDQATSDLERAVVLVEQAIRDLGVDPESTRSDHAGHVAFALRRGSARLLVAIHEPDAERGEGWIRTVAPVVVLPAPAQRPGLYRWLLEANASVLSGAAFGLAEGEVVVVAERSVADLDPGEVDTMIRVVGEAADRYDDELAAAFGAVRSSDR